MRDGNRTDSPAFLRIHSPAKVNLLLHVHGPRGDGFHDLTSLVVPLAFGDTLEARVCEGESTLACEPANLPAGPDNLVIRAARRFAELVSPPHGFAFRLRKRIPVGAGLGGGSSNAAAALRLMNRLSGSPLGDDALRELAAGIGSDCPLFVDPRPCLIGGRGERVEALEPAVAERLRGRALLLFHPGYAVATAAAYRRLAGTEGAFSPPAASAARLQTFASGGGIEDLLDNDFAGPVGDRYLGIGCLLEQLRAAGVPCSMSGSGSACFAFEPAGGPGFAELRDRVAAAWGGAAFCIETSVARIEN